MIKILYNTFFRYIRHGGVSNYLKLLTDNLDKNEFQIIDLSKGKNARIEKITKSSYLTNIISYFLNLYIIIIFKHFLKKYKPHIVHLNPSLNWASIIREFIILKITKKQKFPVLLSIHGWNWLFFNKIKNNSILRPIFTDYIKKADKILVLSYDFKKALIDLGVDNEKIVITSTMVETNKYIPNNKVFNKPFSVLFCSRIIKEKGPFELLNAIPLVIKKYPDTKFIFIGDGKDLKKLKKNSKKLGYEKNIVFTGYISLEEKITMFKKSHIFVFPSLYGEGFPTVILEAMAAGLPVITTPNAGLADAIENNKEGLILNIKPSAIEIAEKILKLLENPNLMNEMSKNNINEVKEKYDIKKICSMIISIYDDILIGKVN